MQSNQTEEKKKNRNYECKLCNKKLYQSSNLKRHMLIHQQLKPFKCLTCLKHFTSEYNLKTHSQIHENKKQRQTLKCDHCDRVYFYKSTLKKHMIKHIKQGPQEQPQSRSLQNHIDHSKIEQDCYSQTNQTLQSYENRYQYQQNNQDNYSLVYSDGQLFAFDQAGYLIDQNKQYRNLNISQINPKQCWPAECKSDCVNCQPEDKFCHNGNRCKGQEILCNCNDQHQDISKENS